MTRVWLTMISLIDWAFDPARATRPRTLTAVRTVDALAEAILDVTNL